MVKAVKLFVEGGGDSKSLRSECRAAFSSFIQKTGLSGYLPRIVASGSRNAAYKDYCIAIKNHEEAVLLVDSETEVNTPEGHSVYDAENQRTWKPWHHLENRLGATGEIADSWKKPSGALDEDCHLMVQLMESWFLADINALKDYYGTGFNEKSIPIRSDIERIAKDKVLASLHEATRYTKKGPYNKGKHSFIILANIDSKMVISKSPWANRFITLLSEKMHSV